MTFSQVITFLNIAAMKSSAAQHIYTVMGFQGLANASLLCEHSKPQHNVLFCTACAVTHVDCWSDNKPLFMFPVICFSF